MKSTHSILCFLLLAFGLAQCTTPQNDQETEQHVRQMSVQTESQTPSGMTGRVYRSMDFGLTWQNISANLSNDIQVSFIRMYEDRLVLATDNAGLLIQDPMKSGWASFGGKLPGKKINALLVDADYLYVGVYQHGVYRTADLGETWEPLTFDLPDLRVQSILLHEDKLFLGTDSGIFWLNDRQEWEHMHTGVQVVSLDALHGNMVAGTNRGTLLSIDNGVKWQWIHQEGAVHYSYFVGDQIAEFCIHGDLFLSNNLGTDWYKADYYPRAGSYVYAMAAAGSYHVLSNNYGIHQSRDGGKTWNLVMPEEEVGFFDLLAVDHVLYGGTRTWDEYRRRN